VRELGPWVSFTALRVSPPPLAYTLRCGVMWRGQVGAANTDIRQLVAVLADDAGKLQWLLSNLQKCVDNGDVMIFAGKKSRVEQAEAALRDAGFRVAALHGDKDQASRMGVLREFKEGKHHVLVATDVAARGFVPNLCKPHTLTFRVWLSFHGPAVSRPFLLSQP